MSQYATSNVGSSRDVGYARTMAGPESDLEVTAVDTIQAFDRTRWNEAVDRSPLGTVFHRYEWLEAIERGLEYPARHLVVENRADLVGLFPNFVVPIPKTPFDRLTSIYPGFGGPLLTDDVPESLSHVSDAIPRLCDHRTIVHEIRASNTNFHRYDDHLDAEGYDSSRVDGRFLLNLASGYDAVFDGMDSSKRRAVRRGRDTDHEIDDVEPSRENLTTFYEAYRTRMESIDGTVYPFAFFDRLRAMDERLLLVSLSVEGEYAGGFLALRNDERGILHGFFAAVPSEYFEYHASELVYDYLFRRAIDEGYEYYDFGGGGADFEDGGFTFKEQFGGRLVPNLYWERGISPVWPLVKRGRSLYWRYGN
ncbi:GNAT family N-acetyltransferase [Natronorubrum sp. DTA28]|uniref:GNAT family N-acetyltransferase n=1 Tax=Natronorubrum sp. DTA28 TaxID=3447019 RepID=UPI003F86EEEE